MLRALRRWYARRGAKSSLSAVVRAQRAKLMLEVDAGEPLTNPVTGGSVFAYQIEIGLAAEVMKTARTGLGSPNPDSTWEVQRPFFKHHEMLELPNVTLRSRDGVRVLMRAGSYRLRDDVTVEGELLPRDHPWVGQLPPWPLHLMPAYRSFSLSRGQVVLLQCQLVPLADNVASAYRGEFNHGCTIEARPIGAELIDVLDLVGHGGF